MRDCLSDEEIHRFLERIQQPQYERIKQDSIFSDCDLAKLKTKHRDVKASSLLPATVNEKAEKLSIKKIPIPKLALELIDWDKPLTFQISKKPREEWFKEILDGKTAYNLRHTFATICQQYVRPDIVDIWMGDSPQRLIGKVYTHFPDRFMSEQMEKVKFPVL